MMYTLHKGPIEVDFLLHNMFIAVTDDIVCTIPSFNIINISQNMIFE